MSEDISKKETTTKPPPPPGYRYLEGDKRVPGLAYWNEPYSDGWELSLEPLENPLVDGPFYAEPIPPEPVGMTEEEYKAALADLEISPCAIPDNDGKGVFLTGDFTEDDIHLVLKMMDYKKHLWEAKQAGEGKP